VPQAGTVKINGLNELLRSLNKIQRGAHKQVLGGLMLAAEPVRTSWVGKIDRYRGVSSSTITPKMTTKGVFITQRARKTTGKRGDFGAIQMRLGLVALFEEADNTTKAVEKALDELTEEAGF
jgi:hypothetical protein